jgi:outer membrane protein assembly factor BamB
MRTLLCLLASLLLVLPASAGQWPGFRGPTGQGQTADRKLPLHWNAESNVLWKTPIPGSGWSSPVVWDDRVFVTTTRESGAQCHVLCLDRKDGRVLWDQRVFEQVPRRKEGKNSYATPTPVTDGRQVYAVFGDGSVAALACRDGQIAWTNREIHFYSRHGLGASPILHEGLVIMPYDGSNPVAAAGSYPNNTQEERLGWQIPWDKAFIAAFDTQTGRRVWTARRGRSRIAHVTPLIQRAHGREQLLSVAGDVVQGFNPRTGERLWSVYCQGEGVVPMPVLGDGVVFTASGYEKTTLRAIRTDGSGEVTGTHIAWEQKKGVPSQSSLLYRKPHVYAVTDGGIATCYAEDSGAIVWQERLGGNYSASPVAADDRAYFLNEAGETVVITLGPTFQILARNPLGEKCQASMAVANHRLFIRTEKNLVCIGQ